MKHCFDGLNQNREEQDITQETIDTMAKSLKKQKSILYKLYVKVCTLRHIFYMLKVNYRRRKYKKLSKKAGGTGK